MDERNTTFPEINNQSHNEFVSQIHISFDSYGKPNKTGIEEILQKTCYCERKTHYSYS